MCGDTVFERGDRVIVTSDITGQTFYGSITSLGAIEVRVGQCLTNDALCTHSTMPCCTV